MRKPLLSLAVVAIATAACSGGASAPEASYAAVPPARARMDP